MVNGFVTGRWYRWKGPRHRQLGWNPNGCMDPILDGEWRECAGVSEFCGGLVRAAFDGLVDESGSLFEWCWDSCLEFFEEQEW